MQYGQKLPLISVIIPAYNCENYLSECLDSVLNQTYKNLECIIINDGSTDNTESIVFQYLKKDFRLKYYSQNNRGVSSARNVGIDKASGEIVTFLDADDWLNEELYDTQIRYIKKNNLFNQNFVVYSDMKIIWKAKNGETIKEKTYIVEELDKDELLKKMLGLEFGEFPPLYFNCAIIKKNIFNNIRFNEELRAYEDLDCWYRILNSDVNFLYVPIVGMYYRKHNKNVTKNKYLLNKNYLMCIEIIYKINKEDLKYLKKMKELLMFFAINKEKEFLRRTKLIIRNSPVPLYTKSSKNLKKYFIFFDKICILNICLKIMYNYGKVTNRIYKYRYLLSRSFIIGI